IVDSLPDINITDEITSSFSPDHTTSTSTSDTTICSDTINSTLDPSSFSFTPKTSEETPRSSNTDSTPGSISEGAPNTSVSEKDSVDNTENNQEMENDMGSADNKQILGKEKSPASNAALKEYKLEQRTQSCCSYIENPVVSHIQSRSAFISWKPNTNEKCDHMKYPMTFELALSDSGKNGNFKNIYVVDGDTVAVQDLQPSTAYFLRVTAESGSEHRIVSEVITFTTSGCEPDAPLAPKLINRTKNSLNLQWKASNNNGSKISSFLLEWDEGKGEDFKSCYTGTMRQYEIFKLNASTKYSFRLAAKNNFGLSNYSEIAVFYTSGNMPPAPLPPKLKEAGIFSLSLEWCAPTNSNPNDTLTYVLEMDEAKSGLGFKPKYNGEDLSCTIRNLQRNTAYKFRMFAYNLEGRSNPSGEVKYSTCPDKPGCPQKPYVMGTIHAHKVKIGWESPKDNGGAQISSYSLEVNENSNVDLWNTIYSGSVQEFLYDHLQPGTTYKLRVFCTSPVGQSQPSDILTIQTPTLPSQSYRSPPLSDQTKSDETTVHLDDPPANRNLETPVHVKKTKGHRNDKKECPACEKKCTAINIVGVGMFGGTGKITTPGTVPSIVQTLQEVENKVPAKMSSTCIALQWEEPDCHGSPITGYNIEYGDKKILTVDRVTECVLKNLQPNTTYKIRIQAINHHGLSPFSQSIRTKTKPLPPDPPNLECVVYGHQSLRMRWGNSSSKRTLANYISYNLLMEDRSGRFSIIYHGPSQTHKVQKLIECSSYRFKIQACNEAGEGPLSDIYTFSTVKTPPVAMKAPKLHPMNNNSCEIKWNSLEPIKGDPIIYCLQVTTGKKSQQIYKGPNTTFSFSNYLTNSRYYFKVCAGRQYENANGIQELWGAYSPSTLFSTCKQSGHGKGSGEINDDTFVLTLLVGFALISILSAVVIQYFLIN
uniref:Fibronectin type III domain containing protein 3C1-like n=1 Tax=Nannospalax galili TaxID=1026970 RepID=A0A8C6RUT6_NANGA